MSIETIYEDINSGRITFGPHLIQRMWENGISIDQVLDTILTGIVNKKEKNERSHGKFTLENRDSDYFFLLYGVTVHRKGLSVNKKNSRCPYFPSRSKGL